MARTSPDRQSSTQTVRPPHIRHVPQIKPHKTPVKVVRITRTIRGRSSQQTIARIEVTPPKVPQVKPHEVPLRTAMRKAHGSRPSHLIVFGLKEMPKVPQTKPHKMPEVIG